MAREMNVEIIDAGGGVIEAAAPEGRVFKSSPDLHFIVATYGDAGDNVNAPKLTAWEDLAERLAPGLVTDPARAVRDPEDIAIEREASEDCDRAEAEAALPIELACERPDHLRAALDVLDNADDHLSASERQALRAHIVAAQTERASRRGQVTNPRLTGQPPRSNGKATATSKTPLAAESYLESKFDMGGVPCIACRTGIVFPEDYNGEGVVACPDCGEVQ
jgi:hypothetical protein